ncbi:MAG: hypothetical protein IPK22_21720 [Verrucomicrobiaceae bacterium]|nr:hypothetical protein [Verrucomicrobiaceae bacterium]
MNESEAARRVQLSRPILAELQIVQLLKLCILWVERLLRRQELCEETFVPELRQAMEKLLQKTKTANYASRPNSVDAIKNRFLTLIERNGGKEASAFLTAINSAVHALWSNAEMEAAWNVSRAEVSPMAAKLGLTSSIYRRPTQIDLESIRAASRQTVSYASLALGMDVDAFVGELQSDCCGL